MIKRLLAFIFIAALFTNAFALIYHITPNVDQCVNSQVLYSLDGPFGDMPVDPNDTYEFTNYTWTVVGGEFTNGSTTYVSTTQSNYSATVNWDSEPRQSNVEVRCVMHFVHRDYHGAILFQTINRTTPPTTVSHRIIGVEQPDAITGTTTALTGTTSLTLSVSDDADWDVYNYKWIFTPVGGTARTYYSTPVNPDISLPLTGSEHGTISVAARNLYCNTTSSAKTATITRKLVTPNWTDTKTPLCNNNSYTTRYGAVAYATSYYVEATDGFLVWNWANYNWQTTTTTSNTYVMVKAPSSGSGSGTISTIAKRSGYVSSDEGIFNIWHGIPPKPTTYPSETGIFQMGLSESESFHVTYGPHADSYSWTISGTIMAISPTTNPFVYVEGVSLGYGYWTCKSINECGQGPAASGTVEVIGRSAFGPFQVYPIPADSYIEIVADESLMDTSKESFSTQLSDLGKGSFFRFVNKTGEVKLTQPYYGEERVKVDVSRLQTGLYTLQLVTPKEVYSKNISILR